MHFLTLVQPEQQNQYHPRAYKGTCGGLSFVSQKIMCTGAKNHIEKLELVINQKEMSSTYWVSLCHDLS